MKKILFAATIVISILTACDDTTGTLGSSLTNPVDNLSVSVDTFTLSTRSVKANAVLCRSLNGYLGKIKDPETGNYVTGDFITQFAVPEANYFPSIDSVAKDNNGNVYAEKSELVLYYNHFYGDSLVSMKTTIYELQEPLEESAKYYSDFNPLEQGMVRGDGIKTTKTYNMIDYTYTDSARNSSGWTNNIRIPLNSEYKDKDGNIYNNIGTYLMRKFYENPGKFSDSYDFAHEILPGFLAKSTGGIGAMAEIALSQLNIHFPRLQKVQGSDEMKKLSSVTSLYGTEEVLQGTHLTNNNDAIDRLVSDKECTYVKAPAGIYTEITIPVLDIMHGHEKDSISSARISLQALNDKTESTYSLPKPKELLLIEADSLTEFFEQGRVTNDERTYTASRSSQNSYTFSNIGILVEKLYKDYTEGVKAEGQNWVIKHPDWNKVLLVPVTTETTSTSMTTITTRVAHDLSLSSTRLIGGANNPYAPVRISIIYSKFSE